MSNPVAFPAIVNGMSGTASFTSSSFWMWETFRLSGQVAVSSGSFVGNVALQVSNDRPSGAFQSQFQPTNWNTIGSTTQLLNCSTTATVRSFMFPVTDMGYAYGRVVFTDLSAGAAVGVFSVNIYALGL